MDDADGEELARSLAESLATLTFVDQSANEVISLLVQAAAQWAAGQGWRVYRRAPSVVRLPPPYADRFSSVDVACARPAGLPIVIEVDLTDRRRTVDKLLAEAAAGRIAIWVRWGTGRFEPPPLPVHMVTCPVTARRGVVGGVGQRLYSRLPDTERPAPAHTAAEVVDQQSDLFSDPG